MKLILSTLMIASLLIGCENNLTDFEFKENVVFTESFENNKQPTDANWTVSSNLASFTASTPENGGTWALELEPGWVPQEGYAERYVTAQPGTDIYTLSAWVKGKGYLLLGVSEGNNLKNFKKVENQSDNWKQITITETFSTQPGDKILVKLSAGMTEVANWKAVFDLVKLEKISE